MKTIVTRLFPLGIILLMVTAYGCEDPIPTDYEMQYVFEGYLLVDRPFGGMTVTTSLPVLDSFQFENSAVTDAVVQITEGNEVFEMEYRAPENGGVGEYFFRDTARKVQPSTLYKLRVSLPDGTVLTGQTMTPERIEWIVLPKDVLQYPVDTTNLPSPDSLKFSWTSAQGVPEYLISVTSLDTLEYGRYLTPPTGEMNRRIERFFEQDAPRYNDKTRWGFLQNTQVPVFWFAFKWFGVHDVTVYAPDQNMIRWFKQTRFGSNEYDPLYGSIDGGLGAFGSASVLSRETFVLKNQP